MHPNVSIGCTGHPAYPFQGLCGCGVGQHACCSPWAGPQAVAWPWWGWWCGVAPGTAPQTPSLSVAKELEASAEAPSVEAIVGGSVAAQIFVEYMKGDGEEPPTVTVTVSTGGGSSTWKDGAIGEGYHVKTDLPVVSPGAKIVVEATNALARAKWLEVTGTSTPA